MIIRAALPADFDAIDRLVTSAFGQKDEAELVRALRAEGAAALELIAEDRKKPIGHVMLSHFSQPRGWLALAPLSVAPKRQKNGIGATLCQIALNYANAPVVVLGNPEYYTRLGFEVARATNLTSPYPLEFTGLCAPDLETHAPVETLVYPAAFDGA